ncbi:MAG: PQQ-binding-like beta-propeller repeat protein [Lentisphaeraceae bacterium]|nr:PQQ-binding-like beta-propeller repeat protein [Lentisphaeraceae bacterium]
MRLIFSLFILLGLSLQAKHKFIAADTTTREVFIVDENGKKTWSFKVPDKPQDVSVLANGNILICCRTIVLEMTLDKKIIWKFKQKGEMHSAQRLADGNTLIGHTSKGRVLVVSPEGEIVSEFKTTYETTKPHMIFRRVRRSADGKIYVAHHGDGVCRIYSPEGKVIASVKHHGKKCFSATPLENQKILLSGGGKIKIVSHSGETYWEVDISELKGHKITGLGSAKILKNGNILVTNWQGHVKKGQRTQAAMIEISPDKKIVWSYDGGKNKCLIAMDLIE